LSVNRISLPQIDELKPEGNSKNALVLMVTEEEAKTGMLETQEAFSSFPKGWIPNVFRSDFSGKIKEVRLLYPDTPLPGGLQRIVFVGLGKQTADMSKSLLSAAFAAADALKKLEVTHAYVLKPSGRQVTVPAAAEQQTDNNDEPASSSGKILTDEHLKLGRADVFDILCRTIILSNYRFKKYKSKQKEKAGLKSLTFVCRDTMEVSSSEVHAGINQAQTVAECVVMAREMANDRADVVTPEYLEKVAKLVATAQGLSIDVIRVPQLKEMGLNLLASVGQAATHPARLIILRYNGNPSSKDTIALVGKGITFDSGGLNIKTSRMEEMHLDMSGSAATLATIKAVAALGIKVNIICALAVAENAINERAYRPNTIIPTPKGSVEVSNTDAEGRLALADAFQYVQKEFKPTHMIDVATLTGSCVAALGESCAGLFSNSHELASSLLHSSRRANERLWRLPIMPDHIESITDGDFCDLRSAPGGHAGACTAAAFLSRFVDAGVEWAHLDIAGPGTSHSKQREYVPKGGTGFGVQLLVDFISQVRQHEAKSEARSTVFRQYAY